MKTIQHTLDTRILIKTAVKYVREKIRKRLEIEQFDDESTNQKESSNEKFNAENQLNRRSFSENDNDDDDAENSTKISIFETFASERILYKLINC
jgi:hypothetical protein